MILRCLKHQRLLAESYYKSARPQFAAIFGSQCRFMVPKKNQLFQFLAPNPSKNENFPSIYFCIVLANHHIPRAHSLIRLSLDLINTKPITSNILEIHPPSILPFRCFLTTGRATQLLHFLLRLAMGQPVPLVRIGWQGQEIEREQTSSMLSTKW